MSKIYIDIETIPNRGLHKPLLDNILGHVKPDPRAKDAEKSLAEKREKILGEAALVPMLSNIVCIGFAVDDHDALAVAGPREADVLAEFSDEVWKLVDKNTAHTVVTYNGKSFDMHHLFVKFALNRVEKLPPFHLGPRRYGVTEDHRDIRLLLANFDQYARGTLEQWAAFFGWPEIREETGAEIIDMYDKGDWAGLAEKCKGDVVRTRFIDQCLDPLL